MRRETVQKPVRKLSSRRARDKAEQQVAVERPEVRKDIRQTWWPEG
jgi:hypothetical protein